MADVGVGVILSARDQASREINKVTRSVQGLEKATGVAVPGLGRFSGGLSTLGLAGAGVAVGVAAIGSAIVDMAKAAAEEEASIARLSAAITAQGSSYAEHERSINMVIEARENLAFADDAQRESLTALVTMTGDVTRAQNLQAIAMDLARGKGMDLVTASELIGKVSQGNTSTLSRYGIVLKEGATAQEALAEIQKRFAGQSEAYAETSVAKWERFNNEIGNIKESIGSGLLPVMTDLAVVTGDVLQDLQDSATIKDFTGGWMEGTKESIEIWKDLASGIGEANAILVQWAVAANQANFNDFEGALDTLRNGVALTEEEIGRAMVETASHHTLMEHDATAALRKLSEEEYVAAALAAEKYGQQVETGILRARDAFVQAALDETEAMKKEAAVRDELFAAEFRRTAEDTGGLGGSLDRAADDVAARALEMQEAAAAESLQIEEERQRELDKIAREGAQAIEAAERELATAREKIERESAQDAAEAAREGAEGRRDALQQGLRAERSALTAARRLEDRDRQAALRAEGKALSEMHETRMEARGADQEAERGRYEAQQELRAENLISEQQAIEDQRLAEDAALAVRAEGLAAFHELDRGLQADTAEIVQAITEQEWLTQTETEAAVAEAYATYAALSAQAWIDAQADISESVGTIEQDALAAAAALAKIGAASGRYEWEGLEGEVRGMPGDYARSGRPENVFVPGIAGGGHGRWLTPKEFEALSEANRLRDTPRDEPSLWEINRERRAAGGPVSAGRPYIVGEGGPELFVPGQGGAVVPNGALGGVTNITFDQRNAHIYNRATERRHQVRMVEQALRTRALRLRPIRSAR